MLQCKEWNVKTVLDELNRWSLEEVLSPCWRFPDRFVLRSSHLVPFGRTCGYRWSWNLISWTFCLRFLAFSFSSPFHLVFFVTQILGAPCTLATNKLVCTTNLRCHSSLGLSKLDSPHAKIYQSTNMIWWKYLLTSTKLTEKVCNWQGLHFFGTHRDSNPAEVCTSNCAILCIKIDGDLVTILLLSKSVLLHFSFLK
jgi:hypothetical protein